MNEPGLREGRKGEWDNGRSTMNTGFRKSRLRLRLRLIFSL
jgi:hypothetical protein